MTNRQIIKIASDHESDSFFTTSCDNQLKKPYFALIEFADCAITHEAGIVVELKSAPEIHFAARASRWTVRARTST